MISLWVQQVGASWYGVAEHGSLLVATVTGGSRDEAARWLQGCIPAGAPWQLMEHANDFINGIILMLAEIESGNEAGKRFTLSPEYVPEPKAGVLCAAAAIPMGYVSTYGNVAAAAGTNARSVGGIMARNPLYPLVPCHRVVGSDMSLVGYRGRQTAETLGAKLERLRAEARGFTEERTIETANGLRVVPVEWVLAKAMRDGASAGGQLPLW
jgi:O-6-methylguanine DNA methyltransferase